MRKVHLLFSFLIFSFTLTSSHSYLNAMEKQLNRGVVSWGISCFDLSYWTGTGPYSKKFNQYVGRLVKENSKLKTDHSRLNSLYKSLCDSMPNNILKIIENAKAIFYKSPKTWYIVVGVSSTAMIGLVISRIRRSDKKKIEEHTPLQLSAPLEKVHNKLKNNCEKIEAILLGFFVIEKEDLKKNIENTDIKFSKKAMKDNYPLIGDMNIKEIFKALQENQYKPLLIDDIKTYDDKIHSRLKDLEHLIGVLIKKSYFGTKKYVNYEPSKWKEAVAEAYKLFYGSLKGKKKIKEIRKAVKPWGQDFKKGSDSVVIDCDTIKYREHHKMPDQNNSSPRQKSSSGLKETIKNIGKGALKGAVKGL